MKHHQIFATLGLVLAIGLPGTALSQAYKWRDEKGGMVFSDQPPPSNIPRANILQAPKLTPSVAAKSGAPATGGASATAPAGKPAPKPAAAPKSTAEQEADYKKRQLEAQKKAKEDGDKSAQEQQRVAACASLQQALKGLEGGQRVSRVDEKGERYFINDDQRAADIAKAKQELADRKSVV